MKKIAFLICFLIYFTGCGEDGRRHTKTPPPPNPSPPVIQLSATALAFESVGCGSNPASRTFEIANVGEGELAWAAANLPAWLILSPESGTAPATVTAQVNAADLSCGETHSHTVQIQGEGADNTPVSLEVTVTIPPPPPPPVPLMKADPIKLTFTTATCGGLAASVEPSFTLSNIGEGSFSWSATAGASWIQFSPASGTDPSVVAVEEIDTADLPCGTTSSGTITIISAEAANSPQSVTVEVKDIPSAAAILPSISALGFFAPTCKGEVDPQEFTIQNNGGTPLGWNAAVTYEDATGWVSIDIPGGTIAAGATSPDITITVDPSALACGRGHSATLTLTATSGGSNVSPVQSKTIQIGLSNPVAWEHQNPKSTSYPINDVTFSEEGIAWAVGDGGTILRSPPDSPDYGNNWIPVVGGMGVNLQDIQFINPFEGRIVGNGGTILHTVDGGATWEIEASPTSQHLQSVYFLDAAHGWAVGNNGTILYWDGSIWVLAVASGVRADQFTHVFMNDEAHGWITTNNANDPLLWTKNNWADILPQDRKSARQLYSLFFLPKDPNSPFPDRLEGWAVGAPDVGGNGSILHIYSDTGSEPWTTEMVVSGTTSTLLDVFMSTPNLGWAVGGDDDTGAGTILQWNGAAWLPATFNAGDPSLPSAKYFRGVASNHGNGVAAGISGTVFTSFNGTDWENVSGPSMSHLKSVGFALDGVNGWAVGDAGTVLTTSNGGASWIKQSAGASNFNGLSVVSATTAWAITSNRQIYHYSSGAWGLNTTLANSGSLKGVHFVNATNGWAVGQVVNGVTTRQVYYYNGTSWSAQTSPCIPAAATMNGVYFLDASNGWMVGTSGWTARTTDGGASWACTQATPTTTTWNAVYFISASTGWAVGSSGRVAQTVNGGLTWVVTQPAGLAGSTLFSIGFSDASNGWIVGASGTVLYTQNGGSSWATQSSIGTNQSLNGVYFAPSGTEGWAVGNNGVILHTDSGGVN